MERKLFFKPGALERFRNCRANHHTKETLRAKLAILKTRPNVGDEVPFLNPQFHQLRVKTDEGTFWVHYDYSDTEVWLLYVGIPGRC